MNWDTPSDWSTIFAIVRTLCRMDQQVISYLSVVLNFCPCIPTSISTPQLKRDLHLLSNSFHHLDIRQRHKASRFDSESAVQKGLHQVLLGGGGGLIDCRGLAGEKDALAEFDYDGVFTEQGFTSLSDLVTHPILVSVVDTDGNLGHVSFSLTVEPSDLSEGLDAKVKVDIPDPNLRAAIAKAIGMLPSAPIVRGNMAALTELDASDASISNLTGLEFATNLKVLYLWNNRISNISAVAGLANLTQLFLERNNISDISAVAGLTKLTRLSLMDNNISDISAVAGLTNLILLHIRGNPISDISAMAGLTKLRWVWGGENNISNISALAGLTKLTKLNLTDNKIFGHITPCG